MTTNIEIYNIDLYSNQYDENTLIHNINKLSLYSILKTQKNISNDFIANFIINPKYSKDREDDDITLQDILKFHPNFGKYEFKIK